MRRGSFPDRRRPNQSQCSFISHTPYQVRAHEQARQDVTGGRRQTGNLHKRWGAAFSSPAWAGAVAGPASARVYCNSPPCGARPSWRGSRQSQGFGVASVWRGALPGQELLYRIWSAIQTWQPTELRGCITARKVLLPLVRAVEGPETGVRSWPKRQLA